MHMCTLNSFRAGIGRQANFPNNASLWRRTHPAEIGTRIHLGMPIPRGPLALLAHLVPVKSVDESTGRKSAFV